MTEPGYRYPPNGPRPGATKPCVLCGHPKSWHQARAPGVVVPERGPDGRYVYSNGGHRWRGACVEGLVECECVAYTQ